MLRNIGIEKKMKIVFLKQVSVEKFQIKMNLLVEEKYPEIIAWLEIINEANGQKRNIVDYFQEILFKKSPKPESFIKNILEELKTIGLIDVYFQLTKNGLKTIETGIAYLPQEGIYEVFVINDPLFPQIIIDYRQLQPSLYDELKSKVNQKTKLQRNIELPSFLARLPNQEEIMPLRQNEKKSIRISTISAKGNKVHIKTVANITLTLDRTITLKLIYKNHTYEIPKPNIQEELLVDECLKQLTPLANLDSWFIPIAYSETNLDERLSFQKSFSIKDMNLKDLGEFSSCKIENVMIRPISNDSAIKWAKDLLLNLINSFITESEFIETWSEITERDEFTTYELPKLVINDIINETSFGSKRYWNLVAPKDLQLLERL